MGGESEAGYVTALGLAVGAAVEMCMTGDALTHRSIWRKPVFPRKT